MASDEQQIRRLMEEWRRRVSSGDVEGLLALTADHAVFLTPGHAPMTKSDFAARFNRVTANVRVEPRYQVKDLGISGDLAYAWSHLTLVFTAKMGGGRTERSGHVLAIFRRNSAGVWQLARSAKLIPAVDISDRL
ncbi:MAG TPA: SgcJ/EcaC family oxidoreductase [Burkholderiales bacterium]|nr:SgcJ/EcaC family oxidoreductase [Burkholderiales bacterium]